MNSWECGFSTDVPFSVISDLFFGSYRNMDLTKDRGFILNTTTAVVVSLQKWCQWCPLPASIVIFLNKVEIQGNTKKKIHFEVRWHGDIKSSVVFSLTCLPHGKVTQTAKWKNTCDKGWGYLSRNIGIWVILFGAYPLVPSQISQGCIDSSYLNCYFVPNHKPKCPCISVVNVNRQLLFYSARFWIAIK